MPRRYHVLLNCRSGTALTTGISAETIAERFHAAGLDATIDADMDRPLADRVADARRSGAEIIVAAGGDGTVTAVAGGIVDTDIALAILPLGTVNLLARDLGIPLDLDTWFDTVETMQTRLMDVGEVNGRIFLHKVVVGFIPGVAKGSTTTHIVETFKVTDAGKGLVISMTFDDPKVLAKPFSVSYHYDRLPPGSQRWEYVCDVDDPM